MKTRRPLVVANWKMNGLRASLAQLKKIIAGAPLAIGGQDCHAEAAGAYTGDISAEMLRDAGASAVIVGHSERRHCHGETDAAVRAKALAAQRAGLLAIICVGETRAERDAGKTMDVLRTQLDGSLPDVGKGVSGEGMVVAYEPVWAIGTGVTPTPKDVGDTHTFIRTRLSSRFGDSGRDMRILYGGSVKRSNARELLTVENVQGALVGGASLDAEEFLAIAGVYRGS
jgi:triosephosphate isomerase (TIM)